MANHPGPARKGRNFTAGACRCNRRLHNYGAPECVAFDRGER